MIRSLTIKPNQAKCSRLNDKTYSQFSVDGKKIDKPFDGWWLLNQTEISKSTVCFLQEFCKKSDFHDNRFGPDTPDFRTRAQIFGPSLFHLHDKFPCIRAPLIS